jgi:hypothetical protein
LLMDEWTGSACRSRVSNKTKGRIFPLADCYRGDSMEMGGHMSGEDEKPKKQGMKLYTPDKSELMVISKIERDGHNLLIHGKIMGSLPMKAVIRPDEARKGIGLIGLKTFLFLLTFLFRGNGKQAGQVTPLKK